MNQKILTPCELTDAFMNAGHFFVRTSTDETVELSYPDIDDFQRLGECVDDESKTLVCQALQVKTQAHIKECERCANLYGIEAFLRELES